VKAEHLGQALLKVTLDNHSAYACMDVMQDAHSSLNAPTAAIFCLLT
jgi:hypothetical protein